MKIRRLVIQTLCLLSLWLGVGLHAQAQADKVTYVYTDPQGTPLVEADASGNVIARYDYTPYGSAVASLGSAPNGPGYTGHVNDPESGFVYMQARYYDPSVGRFLSTDPVGPSPGNLFNFSRYDYASNNPIRNIDPNGKQEVDVEPPRPDEGVDASGNPLEGPNWANASPFKPMPGESSSDFASRQAYAFERMDSTPEKNAADDAAAGRYSNLKDPKNVGPSKPFTSAQKVAILEQNAARNGGVLKSDKSGITLVPSQQSRAGVPTPPNAAQVDHYIPQNPDDPNATPGTNSNSNAQVLSAQENNQKSNTMPTPPPTTNQQ